MNKNLKKMLGLLLSFAMLCSALPLTVMAEAERIDFDADGYAWLQETDYSAKNGFDNERIKAFYSDGRAIGQNTATVPEGGAYVDYYLNVPKSGSYEIWVHGTNPNHDWASPAKLQLDGETVDVEVVGGDSWDSSFVYAWTKATVQLDAGELDLRYLLDAQCKGSGTGGNCIGVLDMICIVPVSYGWTKSLTDKPVKPAGLDKEYIDFDADGYAWLQETDYSVKNGFENERIKDFYSDGRALGQNTTAVPEGGAYVDYYLNVPESGSYEIWVHGTNPENIWASPAKLQLDGETVDVEVVGGDSWDGSFVYAWTKATVQLDAGELDLRYLLDAKCPGQGTPGNCIGVLDMICIVPVSYGWTKSITEKPVKPAEYIEFHEDGYAWLQEADASAKNGFENERIKDFYSDGRALGQNTTAVPEGGAYLDYCINVPQAGSYEIWVHGTNPENIWASPAKLQLDGETVDVEVVGGDSWDSSFVYAWTKATVQLDAGELNLRYLLDAKCPGQGTPGNCIGVLDMICIVPASYGWEKSITDKPVKPLEKFEVTDFAIGGTVAAGQTVTATANVKRNDGDSGLINLILAVYTSDNEMVAIDICELPVGATAVDFDCSIAIKANVEGTLHARAFLWTDFSDLEPITSGISTLE